MWGFQRIAGALVWSLLVILQWAHASFVVVPTQWWLDHVVSAAEETTKATLREWFSLFGRLINGISSWMVAILIDGNVFGRKTKGDGSKRSRAWRDFWAQSKSKGTLNAVIEQEGFIRRHRSPSPPTTHLSSMSAGPSATTTQQGWGWGVGRSSWFDTSNAPSPTTHLNNDGSENQRTKNNNKRSTMRRSGSDLFNRPSGFAVAERLSRRRGLGESIRLSIELAVEAVFTAFRSMVARVLFLHATPRGTTPFTDLHQSLSRLDFPPSPSSSPSPSQPATATSMKRTRSFGTWEDFGVWTASDVILQAGYPLEEHVVTTSDGYVLTMQRIPRKTAKDVVFFQHGIFDTSLGWVANGVDGSQAFAAYDAGADVWLGNCRANPPRAHADASKSGAAYWCYSINELGMEDVAAQVYRIHAVKTMELSMDSSSSSSGVGEVGGSRLKRGASLDSSSFAFFGSGVVDKKDENDALSSSGSKKQQQQNQRRRNLIKRERKKSGGGSGGSDDEQVPPNEAQIREFMKMEMERKGGGGGDGTMMVSSSTQHNNSIKRRTNRWQRTKSLGALLSFNSATSGGDGAVEAITSLPPPQQQQQHKQQKTSGRHGSLPPLQATTKMPIEQTPQDGSECETTTPRNDPTFMGGATATTKSTRNDDVTMTPDRVSVGGREQVLPKTAETPSTKLASPSPLPPPPPPLQWGTATSTTSSGGYHPDVARLMGTSSTENELYRLQAVGHSLGGAALLIYAVMCRVLNKPHHLSRMVLLTPAGFHGRWPKVAWPFIFVLPVVMRIVNWLRPGVVSFFFLFRFVLWEGRRSGSFGGLARRLLRSTCCTTMALYREGGGGQLAGGGGKKERGGQG